MHLDKLYNYLFYLLIFFPFFFISGPFAGDFIISISGLICLIILLIEKKIFKSKILNLFLLWNFYLIINSFFSINPLLSFEQTLFNFRFGFFAISFVIVFNKKDNFLNTLLKSCLLVYFIVSFDALIQFFLGYNLLGFKMGIDDGIRISGIFRDIHILGFFIAYFTPVIISLIFFERKFLYNTTFINFLIFFSFFIILISTERMSLIFYIFNMLLISFFVSKLKYTRYLFLIFILIGTLFVINNDNYKYRFFEQPIKQSSQYINFFKTSKNIFLDNFLFGVGVKNYREVCKLDQYATYIKIDNKDRNACSTHPHNFYLQLLSESGIFGTLPVFFLMMYLLTKIINLFKSTFFLSNNNQKDYYTVILITSFSILFPLFINSSFFYNYTSILRYFVFAFLLLFIFREKSFNE